MAGLETELARQIRRHNYLAAAAAQSGADADAVREQLGGVQADRDRLQLRIDELHLQIGTLHGQIDTLRLQIDSLHRSTSWRITQPLRNVMQWLRRGA